MILAACSSGCVPTGSTTAVSTTTPAVVATSTSTSSVATTTSAPTTTSAATTPSGSTTTAGLTTTTDLTTTSIAVATSSTAPIDPGDLGGWETIPITVGDVALMVAVADESAERSQGLMGIDQLGDLDGMLFVFPQEALTGFWMKDTLISLDIAFFGEDRALVDVMKMVPCVAEPCPSYVPDDPFSWAVETPAGLLGPLARGTMLSIGE